MQFSWRCLPLHLGEEKCKTAEVRKEVSSGRPKTMMEEEEEEEEEKGEIETL